MAATEAGSAAGAVIEGFLSGAERGQAFRRRRTVDRQTAEELERRREAAELDRTRQGIIDEREGERAGREEARFDIDIFERGLERIPEGVTPGAPTGRPRDVDVIGMRDRLREGVGDQLAPGGAAPPGFRRIGPSATEQREALSREQAARVGQMIGRSADEVQALASFDILDDVLRESGVDEAALPFGVNVEGITGRAATPEAAIALREQFAPEITPGADPKVVTDLRAEFARDPIVKDSAAIAQSFARMVSVTEQPSSGAGDLAIIFSFMKLLDPGSVVREGEFANAQNSQGVPARTRALYNRVIAGERLTDETRQEFVGTAENIVAGQREALGRVFTRFEGLAERGGVPIEDVTFDPFGGPDGAGDEDARIEELLAIGLTDEQIEAVLRQEGR